MLRGRVKFMYEDRQTLVSAGDCVHQRPGVRHHLYDDSPDMAYLEIVAPADFKTIDVGPACGVPVPQGRAEHHIPTGFGQHARASSARSLSVKSGLKCSSRSSTSSVSK
jgi:hypothetical protein